MKIFTDLDKVEPVALRRVIVLFYVPLITPILMVAFGLQAAVELAEECW